MLETVWTDASSVGIGVVLEVDGRVVEDASWLRKEADHSHINVAELEAVGRGSIRLLLGDSRPLRWQLTHSLLGTEWATLLMHAIVSNQKCC